VLLAVLLFGVLVEAVVVLPLVGEILEQQDQRELQETLEQQDQRDHQVILEQQDQ
jgi:hypothetical protein